MQLLSRQEGYFFGGGLPGLTSFPKRKTASPGIKSDQGREGQFQSSSLKQLEFLDIDCF